MREIGRDPSGRVAFRIDAHEHDLQSVAGDARTERGEEGERRRAEIRAMREAREYEAPAILERRASEWPSLLIKE